MTYSRAQSTVVKWLVPVLLILQLGAIKTTAEKEGATLLCVSNVTPRTVKTDAAAMMDSAHMFHVRHHLFTLSVSIGVLFISLSRFLLESVLSYLQTDMCMKTGKQVDGNLLVVFLLSLDKLFLPEVTSAEYFMKLFIIVSTFSVFMCVCVPPYTSVPWDLAWPRHKQLLSPAI